MPHLTREADGEAGLCAAGLRVEVVSVAEELGGGGGGGGAGAGCSCSREAATASTVSVISESCSKCRHSKVTVLSVILRLQPVMTHSNHSSQQ